MKKLSESTPEEIGERKVHMRNKQRSRELSDTIKIFRHTTFFVDKKTLEIKHRVYEWGENDDEEKLVEKVMGKINGQYDITFDLKSDSLLTHYANATSEAVEEIVRRPKTKISYTRPVQEIFDEIKRSRPRHETKEIAKKFGLINFGSLKLEDKIWCLGYGINDDGEVFEREHYKNMESGKIGMIEGEKVRFMGGLEEDGNFWRMEELAIKLDDKEKVFGNYYVEWASRINEERNRKTLNDINWKQNS